MAFRKQLNRKNSPYLIFPKKILTTLFPIKNTGVLYDGDPVEFDIAQEENLVVNCFGNKIYDKNDIFQNKVDLDDLTPVQDTIFKSSTGEHYRILDAIQPVGFTKSVTLFDLFMNANYTVKRECSSTD